MTQIAIIGAGPNGISVAAHCQQAGVDFRLFGHTMASWRETMPAGMRLKSSMAASNIVDPGGAYALPRFAQATGRTLPSPLPVEDFVSYGEWIQAKVAPSADPRLVTNITKNGVFSLNMEDGEVITATKVVLAVGINKFTSIPTEFKDVPGCLAAHSTQAGPLARFRGKRVLVIGAGQSAQESTALLHELGADVELVTRRAFLPWLSHSRGFEPVLRRVLPRAAVRKIYHPTDLARQPAHLAVAYPELFRHLPRRWKDQIIFNVMKPAAATWLPSRLRDVKVTTTESVVEARPAGGGLELRLRGGSTRLVDFVLLATGFKPDVRKYAMLDESLLRSLRQVDGYPLLGLDFQTNIRNLYTVGAVASRDHGPITRFVCGSLVYQRLLMPSLSR